MKFKIKQGNKVQIISGKHKGEYSIIYSINKMSKQLILKNINIKTKHIKYKKIKKKGYIKKIEGPIHFSNIKII
uniref:Large ribosomal subunit protein uL24c n=1 Tax=Harveyella mirabilis TaxID=282355 RepID=A0A3S8UVY2_9FLOR|nr:ribosomal protein L24 [Harveyella mirabilis]